MPLTNPKNHNTSKMFASSPSYLGDWAMWDYMVGQVRAPSDHQGVITTYDRRYERLQVVYQATPWVDPNACLAPGFGLIWSAFGDSGGFPSQGAACRNRAYARFKDKVMGESSALGVFAAERREAYGMIWNRTMDLVDAARALRRGDFVSYVKKLGVQRKRKHRNKTRAALHEMSGLWLEYWFGWAPTCSELFNLADRMQQESPDGRYRGTAKFTWVESASSPPIYQGASAVYRAKTGATVRFVNPDLFLLNRMGLANPVAILNELVPFSFVLEWFVKYGAVIDSMTDFLGLELVDPWSSLHLENVQRWGQWHDPGWANTYVISTKSFGSFRTTSLLKPTVVTAKALDIFKPKTRAATAVSLLIQALTSLKQ